MNTSPTTQPTSTTTSAAPSETNAANTTNTTDAKQQRRRNQYTPEERALHVALQAATGMSPAKYCEEMEIHPATFSMWTQKVETLPVARPEGSARESMFARVCVADPVATAPTAHIVTTAATEPTPRLGPVATAYLRDDFRIEIQPSADPGWLASWLKQMIP